MLLRYAKTSELIYITSLIYIISHIYDNIYKKRAFDPYYRVMLSSSHGIFLYTTG